LIYLLNTIMNKRKKYHIKKRKNFIEFFLRKISSLDCFIKQQHITKTWLEKN